MGTIKDIILYAVAEFQKLKSFVLCITHESQNNERNDKKKLVNSLFTLYENLHNTSWGKGE